MHCLEQILEAAPPQNSSCTVTYLLFYKPFDEDKQDMEKQIQTHKQHSLMDTCTWIRQCWLTSKDQVGADTGYNVEDLPGMMGDRDKWQETLRELHVVCATR